jgi:hypothetical protein
LSIGRDESPSEPPVVWHRREREKPAASVIWQTVGILSAGFAFAAALAALTIAESVRVTAAELWIATAGFAILAATCFLAHWDVNRGRRSRDIEVEEAFGSDRRPEIE